MAEHDSTLPAHIRERIDKVKRKRSVVLELRSFEMTVLPLEIFKLSWLRKLEFNGNIRELSPEISKLTRLEILELNSNELSKLPPGIRELTNLQFLSLNFNRFSTFPPEITTFTRLRSLALSGNQLTTVPPGIGNLSQLYWLYLNENALTALPGSIGKLKNLNMLMLNDNPLEELPPEMAELTGLRHLSLSNTRIRQLPPEMSSNARFITLHIANTGMTQLPDDLQVTDVLEVGGLNLTAIPAGCMGATIQWNGIRIDERIATRPETITADEVLTQENVEVRRVMLERMGYERFAQETNPTELHRDTDVGGVRRLLQIDMQRDEPLVMLSVIDPSTGCGYMLRVPPNMQTCHQAAAWIAGFKNPEDYCPLMET